MNEPEKDRTQPPGEEGAVKARPARHRRSDARGAGNGTTRPLASEMPAAHLPPLFYVAVAVAVVAVLVAGFFAFRSFTDAPVGRDPNAALGQLEGKTPEEIQAELDRVVEEGMFDISIASSMELADGASEAELRIENVPGNPYLMRVEITRDDTGEAVYSSGIIEPNRHIQKARLDADLDAGEYPCTAVFYALDPETEEPVGQAAATLTITVLN